MGDVTRCFVILIGVAACGFQGGGNGTQAPLDAPDTHASNDAPPVTCGSLTCDPNATCSPGPPASCACPAGFTDPTMNGFACHDIDECATPATCDAVEMACQNTVGSYVCYTPTSCKDAHDHHAPPGDTMLYFGGDHEMPWLAFCDGVDDYLTVPQGTGAGAKNYAQYTHILPGNTDVRTTYLRVKIDPISLDLDLGIAKFATTSGSTTLIDGTHVTQVSYASAMSCADSVDGAANVDLSGLPFHVKDDGPWDKSSGSGAAFSVTPLDANHQVYSIRGHGHCGWAAPKPVPSAPPINGNRGASKLTLVYVAL